MALYATASELASYLQQDLDTASATLVLTVASDRFASEADTAFTATSRTYSTVVDGCTELELPFRPVTAVSAVRVNTVTITGWVLRLNSLYRTAGFGYRYGWPPDQLDVDLTYGFTTVPDAVKGAVLEIAAQAYQLPVGAMISESIDDYAVRYANTAGGLQLTAGAAALAASYRALLVA
jgi:hypothetical protein